MELPVAHSGSNTWAPSGAAFAGNELLVAALAARGLYAFDASTGSMKLVFSSGDRLRDVMAVGANFMSSPRTGRPETMARRRTGR